MNHKTNVKTQALKLPDPVARALTRYARIVRRIQLWRAAGWLLFAALLGFTLIAISDRWLMIGDRLRFWLALIVYALSIVLVWRLTRKAFRSLAVTEVALALEQRAPKERLQERISTTVELANQHCVADALYNKSFSGAMIQRVAHEAAERAQSLKVEALPDRTPARRACKFACIIIGVMICLCLTPNWNMSLAYTRAFLPWLNLPRPSNTIIEALTGSARVVDGESVNIQARVARKSKLIDEAYLEVKSGNEAWQQLRMDSWPIGDAIDSSSDRASETTIAAKGFALKLGPLHEKLEYRICAGDGQSATYEIAVLSRPEVTDLKIIVHYPAYTELQEQTFDSSNGDLAILKGSRVKLLVNANVALAAATLEFANDHHLSLSVEHSAAVGEFEITADTSYRIRLRSQDGVSNLDAPLLFIHAVTDLPPQVAIIKPNADENVEINAILPFEARGEDDFGISSMRLIAQSEQSLQPVILPLKRPDGASKVWMISQTWDMADLFLENATIITYRVEAMDSNGAVGKSDERRLRVAFGAKQQYDLLLSQFDEAQKFLLSARQLISNAQHDVKEIREVFRADDIEFQAAERLLLSEKITRAIGEIKSAAAAIEKGLPYSESGELQTLLKSLINGLERFANIVIRPLHRAASRANSPQGQIIAMKLDLITQLFPAIAKVLEDHHEALTAAHRYVALSQMEIYAIDARNTQTMIMPVLIGAAGWMPQNVINPNSPQTTGVAATMDERARAAMKQAVSETTVQRALARLQTMITSARSLPTKLALVAALPPKPDPLGAKDSADWQTTVEKQTRELNEIKTVTFALAAPLSQWSDHVANWANAYKATRERYRQAMLQWATKLSNQVFKIAANFHQLQKDALAAYRVSLELSGIARQTTNANRDKAMSQADDMLRVLVEDITQQINDIDAQLHDAVADVRYSVNERRAWQALEHKMGMIVCDVIKMNRWLLNLKTSEVLAKHCMEQQQHIPSLITQTCILQEQAGHLARMSERLECLIALRNELKKNASECVIAREALTKLPSIESAAMQKQAAVNLKEVIASLQSAAQKAQTINDEIPLQIASALENLASAKITDLLEKRATELLAGIAKDASPATIEQQSHAGISEELDKLDKATKAIDKSVAAIDKYFSYLAKSWQATTFDALRTAASYVNEVGRAIEGKP